MSSKGGEDNEKETKENKWCRETNENSALTSDTRLYRDPEMATTLFLKLSAALCGSASTRHFHNSPDNIEGGNKREGETES